MINLRNPEYILHLNSDANFLSEIFNLNFNFKKFTVEKVDHITHVFQTYLDVMQ